MVARVIERPFGDDLRLANGEPRLALCGVDNPQARRVLEDSGFDFVVEAGLGQGAEDFMQIRLHTLPGPRTARELWPDDSEVSSSDLSRAYSNIRERGLLDECGITRLANKAVGAPFVGTVASTLVIAEVLRLFAGGQRTAVLNLDLKKPTPQDLCSIG